LIHQFVVHGSIRFEFHLPRHQTRQWQVTRPAKILDLQMEAHRNAATLYGWSDPMHKLLSVRREWKSISIKDKRKWKEWEIRLPVAHNKIA
jgi:hypothetical protein